MRSRYLPLFILLAVTACQQPGPIKQSSSGVARLSNNRPEQRSNTVAKQTLPVAMPPKHFYNISGYYKETGSKETDTADEGCPIAVTIWKGTAGYLYRLTNGEKHYRGKVTLEKNQDQTTGIIFEGIPYAEYEGDVSQLDDQAERPQPKLPVGVGGLLNGDTIMIQNYGNSMNYYVKFGGCDAKFITLIKN